MTTLETNRSHAARRSASDYVAGLIDTVAGLLHERRQRQKLRNLLDAEPWVLEDMGLVRGDVEWVLSLPLHVRASDELERSRDRLRQKF